jgi:hypothetical protein
MMKMVSCKIASLMILWASMTGSYHVLVAHKDEIHSNNAKGEDGITMSRTSRYQAVDKELHSNRYHNHHHNHAV